VTPLSPAAVVTSRASVMPLGGDTEGDPLAGANTPTSMVLVDAGLIVGAVIEVEDPLVWIALASTGEMLSTPRKATMAPAACALLPMLHV
jgi:hypothetical protein